MKASTETLKVGDTVIFLVDEWNNGTKDEFDGQIVDFRPTGPTVMYLSGYRSRTDDIPWEDVLAKVDKRRPWVTLSGRGYEGNFQVFGNDT